MLDIVESLVYFFDASRRAAIEVNYFVGFLMNWTPASVIMYT